jgi:hypothetical protein
MKLSDVPRLILVFIVVAWASGCEKNPDLPSGPSGFDAAFSVTFSPATATTLCQISLEDLTSGGKGPFKREWQVGALTGGPHVQSTAGLPEGPRPVIILRPSFPPGGYVVGLRSFQRVGEKDASSDLAESILSFDCSSPAAGFTRVIS